MRCFAAAVLAISASLFAIDSSFAGVSSEIGVEVFRLEYREPGVMQETGVLPGIYGSYTHVDKKLMVRASLSIADGSVQYDGALFDGTPFQINSRDSLIVFRLLGGYQTDVGSGIMATPFSGFGVRMLVDRLPSINGYTREQTYLYVPIGVETARKAGNWLWGVRAEYDLFLQGRNHSYGHLLDVNLIQNSGYGFQGSVYFSYRAEQKHKYSLSIEPFFRYWDVGRSEIVQQDIDSWYEPENNTAVYGLRGSILF